MFAPDPQEESDELVAHIDYSDGSTQRWAPPRGSALLCEYRTYHWAAESSRLRQDAARDQWKPFAEWLARTQDHDGRQPVRIELFRGRRLTRPPGSDLPTLPWEEFVFYVHLLDGGDR